MDITLVVMDIVKLSVMVRPIDLFLEHTKAFSKSLFYAQFIFG